MGLLEILPPDRTVAILRYLAGDYWGRYLGWPDLVAHRDGDYFFVEVKGSGDTFSDEQKDWIEGNALHLRLPFKVYRVHRRTTVDAPP